MAKPAPKKALSPFGIPARWLATALLLLLFAILGIFVIPAKGG